MKLFFSLLVSITFTVPAWAEIIQILHTNDLHSHLEHSMHLPDVGGYARLKSLIANQRAKASKQGIGTISMDGGDFMEGSIYYLADKGRKTFEAFNDLGHDVAVLGNHDYLMAPTDLDAILRDVPGKHALLAANFKVDSKYTHINEKIKPVWEGVVSGVKVGVIGLTTNDLLYKWRLDGDGRMMNEYKTAEKWAKYLRNRGAEVVIALTHIGVKKDRILAKKVPEIDLIVGGHSHTALHEVIYQESKNKKLIPIVQAGDYGEWLGRLLMDYDRDSKTLKVVDYKLMPVVGQEKDPQMVNLIADANRDLHDEFGEEWLNETVGESTLRPLNLDDAKVWHYFINDAMLEATGADFAIHAPALSGKNFPVGTVSRRSLYDSNPRTFDMSDKYGYNIHTAKIMGGWIKMIAVVCIKMNIPLYFSGLKFKWTRTSKGKVRIWDVTHNGKKIHPFKYYNVAFSEGIVRGAYEITKLTHFVIHEGRNEKLPMWLALEEKLRRTKVITPDYLDGYFEKRSPASEDGYERMLLPGNSSN